MKIHFLMPAMPLFTSCPRKNDPVKAEDRFEECDGCINRKYDPEQCDECEDADHFEPYEEEDSLHDEESEDMTIEQFKEYWRHAA